MSAIAPRFSHFHLLQGVVSLFAAAYANNLFDRIDKYFTITKFPGLTYAYYDLNNLIHPVIPANYLHFDLRIKVTACALPR